MPMQMSFPHTCIVSHFSSSSRVRETNKVLPTRPVQFIPHSPQLCQGDVQLQLCTNTFTKKSYQCTSTTAQETHRASLTPTTNLAPDAAVPVSLRQERMQTAPTPMNFPNRKPPVKKEQRKKGKICI